MWRRPDNRRNSGDAYTTSVSNRGIQVFPPPPGRPKSAFSEVVESGVL